MKINLFMMESWKTWSFLTRNSELSTGTATE